jgi:hypothetical protein
MGQCEHETSNGVSGIYQVERNADSTAIPPADLWCVLSKRNIASGFKYTVLRQRPSILGHTVRQILCTQA